jgi:hypothetical protein
MSDPRVDREHMLKVGELQRPDEESGFFVRSESTGYDGG